MNNITCDIDTDNPNIIPLYMENICLGYYYAELENIKEEPIEKTIEWVKENPNKNNFNSKKFYKRKTCYF